MRIYQASFSCREVFLRLDLSALQRTLIPAVYPVLKSKQYPSHPAHAPVPGKGTPNRCRLAPNQGAFKRLCSIFRSATYPESPKVRLNAAPRGMDSGNAYTRQRRYITTGRLGSTLLRIENTTAGESHGREDSLAPRAHPDDFWRDSCLPIG